MELPDFGQGSTQPKRKRGRPPKVRYPIPSEAEFPASHLTDDRTIKELQLAYKPLKEIMGISKLRLLVEKPDELLYGLYDYYDIIEKPMWFLEMTRKYAEKEYNSAVEVMDDIRLVLENCYKFWGKKHKFVKQALRAERIVAKHIAGFPPEITAKCCLALYDSEDALSTEQGSDTQNSYLTDGYTSKILQNLEKKPITTKMGATVEEMQKWEEEVLQAKQNNVQINIVSELAEVGQFLVMAQEILCLKPISQFEIERMLLISRESSTLATIMTSFLCPTVMRAALYFKPIMIYDVWASLLQKKLDTWYNAYAKYKNRMQVFLKYGVEPSFFDTVGEVNPLVDAPFHELSLIKKSSILKALCSNMFHSNKKIEEYFNLVDENSLKSKLLYSDSKYDYVSLFSPEIRVYRSSRICLEIDETIESVYPGYFNYYPRVEGNGQELLQGSKDSFSRKQKFCLIANDTDSLVNLSKLCAKKKRSRAAVNRLLAEEKNRELTLIGLRALYSQWNKAIYKDPASVEISRNYWISKVVNNPSNAVAEAGDVAHPENPCGLRTINPTPGRELGKRIMKRKFPIDDMEDSFSSNDDKPNEEDVSDWEDGNIRRSRRIKKVTGLPRFFDHKYMKFDDATEGEYVYGNWINGPEENEPLKKPRKKRLPKQASDSQKERTYKRVSKAEKTAMNKQLLRISGNSGVQTTKPDMFDCLTLPVIKDEPYMPPNEVPKLPLPCQFGKDPKVNHLGPRLGDPTKNDLLSDINVWDFGLSGFPAFAPLKPVNDACLPEDGDKKLLELGAFKKEEAPKKLDSTNKIKPVKLESQKPVAPPIKRNRAPFQNLFPVSEPSMVVIPSRNNDRLGPQPGPSKILNRVFLPRQDMMRPRLMAGVVPAEPRDMLFLRTGLTKVKQPVHHVPHQNLMIKRKVHLPARPISIPLVKNQILPVFENASWAKHSLSERTVLYIPSGTPTITIPSTSASKKERTFTLL
uniref:Bromo domain-containing protein n=1 Tax=Lygus hesperus TaxID=30085 RepID=A0A0A9WCA8_LYGHE